MLILARSYTHTLTRTLILPHARTRSHTLARTLARRDGALFAHDGALVAHDGALFARHDGALFARLDVRAPARHGAFVSVGRLSVPDTLLSAPVPVPVPARVGVQRITTEHCSRRRPRR